MNAPKVYSVETFPNHGLINTRDLWFYQNISIRSHRTANELFPWKYNTYYHFTLNSFTQEAERLLGPITDSTRYRLRGYATQLLKDISPDGLINEFEEYNKSHHLDDLVAYEKVRPLFKGDHLKDKWRNATLDQAEALFQLAGLIMDDYHLKHIPPKLAGDILEMFNSQTLLYLADPDIIKHWAKLPYPPDDAHFVDALHRFFNRLPKNRVKHQHIDRIVISAIQNIPEQMDYYFVFDLFQELSKRSAALQNFLVGPNPSPFTANFIKRYDDKTSKEYDPNGYFLFLDYLISWGHPVGLKAVEKVIDDPSLAIFYEPETNNDAAGIYYDQMSYMSDAFIPLVSFKDKLPKHLPDHNRANYLATRARLQLKLPQVFRRVGGLKGVHSAGVASIFFEGTLSDLKLGLQTLQDLDIHWKKICDAKKDDNLIYQPLDYTNISQTIIEGLDSHFYKPRKLLEMLQIAVGGPHQHEVIDRFEDIAHHPNIYSLQAFWNLGKLQDKPSPVQDYANDYFKNRLDADAISNAFKLDKEKIPAFGWLKGLTLNIVERLLLKNKTDKELPRVYKLAENLSELVSGRLARNMAELLVKLEVKNLYNGQPATQLKKLVLTGKGHPEKTFKYLRKLVGKGWKEAEQGLTGSLNRYMQHLFDIAQSTAATNAFAIKATEWLIRHVNGMSKAANTHDLKILVKSYQTKLQSLNLQAILNQTADKSKEVVAILIKLVRVAKHPKAFEALLRLMAELPVSEHAAAHQNFLNYLKTINPQSLNSQQTFLVSQLGRKIAYQLLSLPTNQQPPALFYQYDLVLRKFDSYDVYDALQRFGAIPSEAKAIAKQAAEQATDQASAKPAKAQKEEPQTPAAPDPKPQADEKKDPLSLENFAEQLQTARTQQVAQAPSLATRIKNHILAPQTPSEDRLDLTQALVNMLDDPQYPEAEFELEDLLTKSRNYILEEDATEFSDDQIPPLDDLLGVLRLIRDNEVAPYAAKAASHLDIIAEQLGL